MPQCTTHVLFNGGGGLVSTLKFFCILTTLTHLSQLLVIVRRLCSALLYSIGTPNHNE